MDHHAAFLTVKETLEFARNCGQVWTYKDYGPEMKVRMGGRGWGGSSVASVWRREKLKPFGLRHVTESTCATLVTHTPSLALRHPHPQLLPLYHSNVSRRRSWVRLCALSSYLPMATSILPCHPCALTLVCFTPPFQCCRQQEIMGEALRMGQDPKIEMVTRMMRLTRAANLPVGNPMIPTTSPAERRRLTAAELLASIFPVMVFDDLNAGERGAG